ncbi:MAG: hypothetical protein ACAI35_22260 [Candidatus Methylacidiphilales bacterium]|nr:hypothetical protein [Candidatus Methylacidiphilales bacterium]
MRLRIISCCVLLLSTILMAAPLHAGAITVKDADDRNVTFNPAGKTVVVLNCNPTTQWRTRDAGMALDTFQGNKNFRLIVLVDLRSSMAKVVKGYVMKRMRTDLDAEAVRIKPFYAAKGNLDNPRNDISVIPDWNGSICAQLSWPEESPNFRAVVFKDGQELKRFDNLTEDGPLVAAVRTALTPKPAVATKAAKPATETPKIAGANLD